MPFRFIRTEFPEVLLIEPQMFADERGYFMETYKHSEFAAHGVSGPFVQTNHAYSTLNTLRGLHYQKRPKPQGKLGRVIHGTVFDVVVDIRKHSPSYGRWLGVTLSTENKRIIYVPPGFAHGYCAMSDHAEFVYMVTAEYAPELESGIIWNDPELAIRWPVDGPHVSERDRGWPQLRDADNNFDYRSDVL